MLTPAEGAERYSHHNHRSSHAKADHDVYYEEQVGADHDVYYEEQVGPPRFPGMFNLKVSVSLEEK